MRTLHPLLVPEVQRWLGTGTVAPEVESMLSGLTARLHSIDGLLTADGTSELEAFFRLSGDLLVVIDDQLCVRHLNSAFEPWGVDVVKARNTSCLELIAPRERDATRATLSSMLRSREQVPLLTHMVAPRGDERVVHWQLTTNDEGTRIYGVGRDVTEQQSMEHQLHQAQRLESVGKLAAGVAHEVNTPLQFIGDNLGFVEDAMRDVMELLSVAQTIKELAPHAERIDLPYLQEQLPPALTSMRDGLARVRDLVRSLKEMAPGEGELVAPTEAVDLAPMLRTTLKTATENELKGLKLDGQIAELPRVPCHVGGITRVFSALLANASQAIAAQHGPGSDEGCVTISTKVDAGSVVIAVGDNGTGIPESIRSRVFEPFFTTRDVGQGSGQSLAVARSIVDRHGGRIDFETECGRGTTFRVWLPLGAPTEVPDADLWV